MRIKSNKLKDIRRFFLSELNTFYSEREIDNFFFLCCYSFSNLGKTQVLSNLEKTVSESVLLKYNFAVKDLKNQKPIQYILHTAHFFDLELEVDENVLIPRPETEELVAWILEETKPHSMLADFCTGSGCIALALKKHHLELQIQAFDISKEALNIAKKNAQKYSLDVDFVEKDVLQTELFSDDKWDVIVSNPPYVRNLEKQQMHANVLNYEPHLALFVDDENPLIFYKSILKIAQKSLNPNGVIYFEINEALAQETIELANQMGFPNHELRIDMQNKNRMLKLTNGQTRGFASTILNPQSSTLNPQPSTLK